MSTRLSRKFRKDIEYPVGKLKITDVFDNGLKDLWRASDVDLDYISVNATDEDLSILLSDAKTYKEKKIFLHTLNKYL